jgi:aspartyl/asparaginyl beta-hydroxylase (cupin superfamily)
MGSMRLTRTPLQRCKHFVPGLKSGPWLDGTNLPLVSQLEAAFPMIQSEFFDIALAGQLKMHPQTSPGGDMSTCAGRWRIFSLAAGRPIDEGNSLEAPITTQLLRAFPETWGHPMGLAYFSVLEPDVQVPPHCGPTNTRIRIHLGLRTHPEAKIRVGNEVRTWQEGRCVVFDDSWEHEVVNRSDHSRAVLIVDIWHPDLTKTQREALIREDHPRALSTIRRRRGWYYPTEPSSYRFGADAITTFGCLDTNRVTSIAKTASNLLSAANDCTVAASKFVLAAIAGRDGVPSGSQSAETSSAMTTDDEVWRSILSLPHDERDNGLPIQDLINLLHIHCVAWRSDVRNVCRTREFVENWPTTDRVQLYERIFTFNSAAAILASISDDFGLAQREALPFGVIVPLLTTALRRILPR